MLVEELRGKNIAVLGLSVEGTSTANFLEGHGLPFTVLDQKMVTQFDPQRLKSLRGKNNFILGPAHLDNLADFDLIFRTPGFPLWHPKLLEAQKSGGQITSQIKLFFDLCPCPIVGVTGTKGKGTTSMLIYEMLKSSGFDVYLGGNIGHPPLDFLDYLKEDSIVVLELSSFQLEDLHRSPHLAVVLMTTSEHLSSQAPDSPNHHRNLGEYIKAKENIVRFQKNSDIAVINYDYERSRDFSKVTQGKIYFVSVKEKVDRGLYIDDGWLISNINGGNQRLVKTEEVFLRGPHNLQNALAAAGAALSMGAAIPDVANVIRTFRGLEHRLEFVREVNGVKYYNDSFSTTPETAMAAIKSFNEPEILILGGSDKGSDYRALGENIINSPNVKAVILVGSMAGKIETSINQAKIGSDPILIGGLGSMPEIVQKCSEIGSRGDVVILSPACASFDMFKNYKDRGQQFKDEVNRL